VTPTWSELFRQTSGLKKAGPIALPRASHGQSDCVLGSTDGNALNQRVEDGDGAPAKGVSLRSLPTVTGRLG
jgi:hypothetical protein